MTSEINKLHKLLVNESLSSLELAKTYLDTCESKEATNAFITVNKKRSIERAQMIDEKIAEGKDISRLCGIPMAIKDDISTIGLRTTAASKMLDDYSPIFNASVIDALGEKNVLLIGKTNLSEFSCTNSTETSYYGESTNPEKQAGSVDGAAIAVSTRQAVYALSSDIAGSSRLSANDCGVFALKPSYGLVSKYGLISYASSFDQISVLASSVSDISIVFDTINFYDEKDQASVNIERKASYDKLENSIEGKKIGVFKNLSNLYQDEELNAYYLSQNRFKSLGAEIVELDIFDEQLFKDILTVYYILSAAEASSNIARYNGIIFGHASDKAYKDVDEFIVNSRTEAFGFELKQRLLLGTYVLHGDNYKKYYQNALNMRSEIIKKLENALENVDMLMTVISEDAGLNSWDKIDKDIVNPAALLIANIAGLPAMNIVSQKNLKNKYGVQLIGKRFDDNLVLNFAHKHEEKRNEN